MLSWYKYCNFSRILAVVPRDSVPFLFFLDKASQSSNLASQSSLASKALFSKKKFLLEWQKWSCQIEIVNSLV